MASAAPHDPFPRWGATMSTPSGQPGTAAILDPCPSAGRGTGNRGRRSDRGSSAPHGIAGRPRTRAPPARRRQPARHRSQGATMPGTTSARPGTWVRGCRYPPAARRRGPGSSRCRGIACTRRTRAPRSCRWTRRGPTAPDRHSTADRQSPGEALARLLGGQELRRRQLDLREVHAHHEMTPLSGDGRIGEVRHAVGAHARGPHQGCLLALGSLLGSVRPASLRVQRLACGLSRLKLRRVRVEAGGQRLGRVREVRHPVGAHARGEGDRAAFGSVHARAGARPCHARARGPSRAGRAEEDQRRQTDRPRADTHSRLAQASHGSVLRPDRLRDGHSRDPHQPVTPVQPGP